MTANKPRVLVVAPWVYHPGCGIGGGVLCYQSLEPLAQDVELHWLSFDHTVRGLEEGKAALARLCRSVTTVPLPHRRYRLLWLQQLFGGPPVEAEFNRSDPLRAAVRALCHQHAIDVVWLQFPEMGQYTDAAPAGVRVVMDTQDVWSVSMFRSIETLTGWARMNAFLIWQAWARHELKVYRRADVLLALSENDAGVLRSFLPQARVELVPVATPMPEAANDVSSGPDVLMLGNFAHHPNADGLRWMIEQVWPRVRQAMPDARLLVAGPGWSERSNDRLLGIETLGFVEDLDPVFARARVSVVPYRFGGGVKIKAVESMARGLPVVATRVGAEGLRATDGVNMLIADEPTAFADAVIEVLADASKARRIGDAARRHAVEQFSPQARASILRSILSAPGRQCP